MTRTRGKFVALYGQALGRRKGPIAEWILNEESGTTAFDTSGNLRNGTYANTYTLSNYAMPNAVEIANFNEGRVAIYSDSLRDAFSLNLGSIVIWIRRAAAQWESGLIPYVINLRGSTEWVYIAPTVSYYTASIYRSGGNSKSAYLDGIGQTGPVMIGATWQAGGSLKAYSNGQLSATATGLGTASQQISSTYSNLGAASSASSAKWIGELGYCKLWKRILSASEMKAEFEVMYPTTSGLMVVGDSKSTGAPAGWLGVLCDSLEAQTAVKWILKPMRYALGGYDITEIKDNLITPNLSSETETPDVIIMNAGANDIPQPTPEAQFKADYKSVVDSLRAKYPGVNIYIAKVWRQGYVDNVATINGYIDWVVAQYGSGVYAGPNEAVWLEGGDDGATYTSDGVHYSNAAQTVCAAQWMTAMGY